MSVLPSYISAPNLTMSIQWAEAEPEPLCLISNLPLAVQPHLLYQMRWIETLFSNCKSRGLPQADVR
ncbi:MAG: hypothetical protein U0401_09500 [Anaerolineae bacterium]